MNETKNKHVTFNNTLNKPNAAPANNKPNPNGGDKPKKKENKKAPEPSPEKEKDNSLWGWAKWAASFAWHHITHTLLLHISLILFIIILPIIYYMFLLNTGGALSNNQSSLIILTLVVGFSMLAIIVPGYDTTLAKSKRTLASFLQYYAMLGYVLILFVIFIAFFHLSKFIIYKSFNTSVLFSTLLTMLLMTLYYNSILKPVTETKSEKTLKGKFKPLYSTKDLVEDVIFYIPCLINETFDFIRYYFKSLPPTNTLVTTIIAGIIVMYYVIPFVKNYFKSRDGVKLIDKQTELNRMIINMDQDTLNRKVVDNSGILKKQILKQTYGGFEGFDIITKNNPHILDNQVNSGIPDNSNETTETNDDWSTLGLYKNVTDKVKSFEDHAKDQLLDNTILHDPANKLSEYNEKKNSYLSQQKSDLVDYINTKNKLTEYNYHYGLSFWLFMDSNILKQSNKKLKGLILSYADKPRMYFNYETKELVIDIQKCKNGSCSSETIYKTDKILYQKWNNIVINYNYGTLDIFINNNLVLSYNDMDPYINPEKNSLQVGSEQEPLSQCGICNMLYRNEPFNLLQIERIYSKRNNPCE